MHTHTHTHLIFMTGDCVSMGLIKFERITWKAHIYGLWHANPDKQAPWIKHVTLPVLSALKKKKKWKTNTAIIFSLKYPSWGALESQCKGGRLGWAGPWFSKSPEWKENASDRQSSKCHLRSFLPPQSVRSSHVCQQGTRPHTAQEQNLAAFWGDGVRTERNHKAAPNSD